jgi:hypothetical protein
MIRNMGRTRRCPHMLPPGRQFDLSDRRQRAWVYEIVLREGTGADISTYVDGVVQSRPEAEERAQATGPKQAVGK